MKSSSNAAPRGEVVTPSGHMDAVEASHRGVKAFTIILYDNIVLTI